MSFSLKLQMEGKGELCGQKLQQRKDARFQLLTKDEFSKLQDGYKPVTTLSAQRALNNFEAWRGACTKAQKE